MPFEDCPDSTSMMLNRLGCANIDTGNKRQKYACLHGSKFSLPDEDRAGQEEEEEQAEDEKNQQVRKHEEEQDMMKEQHQDSQHMAVMATMQEMGKRSAISGRRAEAPTPVGKQPGLCRKSRCTFCVDAMFGFSLTET